MLVSVATAGDPVCITKNTNELLTVAPVDAVLINVGAAACCAALIFPNDELEYKLVIFAPSDELISADLQSNVLGRSKIPTTLPVGAENDLSEFLKFKI